jgi:hypothetical protein
MIPARAVVARSTRSATDAPARSHRSPSSLHAQVRIGLFSNGTMQRNAKLTRATTLYLMERGSLKAESTSTVTPFGQ